MLIWLEAAQPPADPDTVRLDPRVAAQMDHQFIKRQVALLLDPPRDPVHYARQLAKPAAVALRLGFKRPRPALRQDHVVHKLDRNKKLSRRRPMRMTFLNKINNALMSLYRKRHAYQ